MLTNRIFIFLTDLSKNRSVYPYKVHFFIMSDFNVYST